jgi:hypothetical protein
MRDAVRGGQGERREEDKKASEGLHFDLRIFLKSAENAKEGLDMCVALFECPRWVFYIDDAPSL